MWPARASAQTSGEELGPLAPPIVHPPARAVWRAADGGASSVLVPAVEVIGLNVGLWAVAKARGQSWAQISPQTMWDHLRQGPWIWDDDPYLPNELGHPYQGSLSFSAARSSGLGFWTSVPFAFVSSGSWELFMEVESPSKNDLITTTVGGIVLGEILHRLSLQILDSGSPTWPRWLFSSLVDPMGAFNRYFFGRRANDFYPHTSRYARFLGGFTSKVVNYAEVGGVIERRSLSPQLVAGFDIISSLPGNGRLELRRPFDHFEASARVAFMSEFQATAFLRGMLRGWHYGAERFRGFWGFYTGYDFSNQSSLRIATVNVGVGSSAQLQLGDKLYLLPTLIVSGIPFGGGGTLSSSVGNRDYQIGPGFQAFLRLSLVRAGLFQFGSVATLYRLYGTYVGEGTQTIWAVNGSADIAVSANHAFGVSAAFATGSTVSAIADDTYQHSVEFSVTWSLTTDDAFGAFVR